MGGLWRLCLAVAAAALMAFGAFDGASWTGGGMAAGLVLLLLSFGVWIGVARWHERQNRRLMAVVRLLPGGSDHTGGGLPFCDLNWGEPFEREIESYRQAERSLLALIRELFVPEEPGRRLIGASLNVSSWAGEHASGDFFECVPWNGSVFDVIVGNVMGGGLAAALIGVEAKSGLLRAVTNLMTQGGNAGLPEVVQVVGHARRFVDHKLAAHESFITQCYARFDFEERTLTWVDCGHAPILHWQASARRTVSLKGSNMPIGFVAEEAYQPFQAGFASGDLFVIYSDGMISVRNPDGEVFGVERLASAVEAAAELPADEIARALRLRLAAFAQKDALTQDEQTVVCVRVHATKSTQCKRIWRFDFPAQLSALNLFRQHVHEVYADPAVLQAVSPDKAEMMLLALHEVLVNIIGHSARTTGEESPMIRLEASLFEDRIEWTFAHRMAFFSPTRIHTPSGDGSQSDGYGLFIIEQIADRVRYFRNERGESCVSLIKWFCSDLTGGTIGEAKT